MKRLILMLGDQPSLWIQEGDRKIEVLDPKAISDYFDELTVKSDNRALENVAVSQLEQGVNYLQKQLAHVNPRIGRVTLTEIYFNGLRCVNALIRLTHSINTKFIRIDDHVLSAAISHSDKEKLSTLLAAKQYSVILPDGEVVKPSVGDNVRFNHSTYNIPKKMSQLIAKFSALIKNFDKNKQPQQALLSELNSTQLIEPSTSNSPKYSK